MSGYYFSRARLSDDATVKAIFPLLKSGGSSHSLIWSLFAGHENQGRDFLYRENKDGWFYILSARKPVNANNLFHLDEPKEFAPNLQEGDCLQFSLRANPVVRRRIAGTRKSKKMDVVMDALYRLPDKKHRGEKRDDIVREAGTSWLTAQGKNYGFALASAGEDRQESLKITGYHQTRIYQKNAKNPLKFSSLDFDGILRVTDPSSFHAALYKGLGSAKGYGCGLMMIRRA
ncbi:MAG: type I-E CRISPR-associated protein Cas6/Cse3/CasE [Proteobacteria bacterium]|nr:type I-E CRISPR-associated protein Cas6/Cse3/CasE [Pseudomonadota bacterium]